MLGLVGARLSHQHAAKIAQDSYVIRLTREHQAQLPFRGAEISGACVSGPQIDSNIIHRGQLRQIGQSTIVCCGVALLPFGVHVNDVTRLNGFYRVT